MGCSCRCSLKTQMQIKISSNWYVRIMVVFLFNESKALWFLACRKTERLVWMLHHPSFAIIHMDTTVSVFFPTNKKLKINIQITVKTLLCNCSAACKESRGSFPVLFTWGKRKGAHALPITEQQCQHVPEVDAYIDFTPVWQSLDTVHHTVP